MMAIPGLSQYFGKIAKKKLQQPNSNQQPKGQPAQTGTKPFKKASSWPNQMDWFSRTSNTDLSPERQIVKRHNSLPLPGSILKNGAEINPEGRSIMFGDTVKTRYVFFNPVDGRDKVLKGTRPLAESKLNAPALR